MTENEKLRALLAEARERLQDLEVLLADAQVELRSTDAGIKWITIPAGSVTTQDGRVLTVKRPFQLATTPTTQAQYEAVMHENPSHFRGATLPVERVSEHDADAFAAKIGARLPTGLEWEYAALAGTSTDPYGPIEEVAWCWKNSNGRTHPVGTKLPNAWGLYDMLGNVWEWTAAEERAARVYLGGSWYDVAAWLRASYRSWSDPGDRFNDLGFRCARGVL